jgi:phenylacetate-CoA ligase
MRGFKSYFPADIWPSSSNHDGSDMGVLLGQLEKSQYMSPDALLHKQFLYLNKLFKYSFRTVPFYRRNFKAAGLKKKNNLTVDQWEQVPILTRSTVQQEQKKMVSKFMPFNHGGINRGSTSGSTGMPLKFFYTQLTPFFRTALSMRFFYWHKVNFTNKAAIIRVDITGESDYPGITTSTWVPYTLGIDNPGPTAILNSSTEISKQAEFLIREQPDILISYPSNIKELALYFIEKGMSLKQLNLIQTLGETVNTEVRDLCKKAWGASTIDVYSAMEANSIAIQCPEYEDIYHIMAESVYVEVVDDDGEPCKPGEIGKVLLTTLHNYAMPLIRYEIGDYAKVGSTCSCGRTLPVLNQIMGRSRNMLILPNGEKVWPSLLTRRWIKKLPMIQQFQFVQTSLDLIEAHLVADSLLSKEQEDFFKDALHNDFMYPFKIDIHYHDKLSRNKGGKFEDFISKIS